MKKFTFMLLFAFCAIGYGQSEIRGSGEDSPQMGNKRSSKQGTIATQNSTSSLKKDAFAKGVISSPVKLKQKSAINDSEKRSATSSVGYGVESRGALNLLPKSLFGSASLSVSNTGESMRITNPPAGTASIGEVSSHTGDRAPIVITHNVSQNIVGLLGVACGTGGVPAENSYYRYFDLATDFGVTDIFNVSSIEFAIEEISGPVSLTFNIYSTSGTFPAGFPGNATLQGTANYTAVVADKLTVVSVPLGASIPAGSKMIYEYKINAGASSIFYPGANDLGQTGISWISAGDCGITSPTDLTALGFGTTHMLMNVVGEVGGGTSTFPDPYCGPLAYTSGVEPITFVDVAGISNRTSEVLAGATAHEDFTSIVGEMEEGETYTITLEGNTSGNFTNRFAVFIDWNQNGVLDDVGEVFEITNLLVNSTGVDGKQVTGTITVPAGAMVGETRMRIKKMFGSANYLNPCLGGGYGQAEDYTIEITTGGSTGTACADPVLEVNQDFDNTCMAFPDQGGLAQSYKPTEVSASGAGIKFLMPSVGLDVTLSLWDGLPNAAGNMLATATTQTAGDLWVDVFWNAIVDVTVGDTYFIVIEGDPALPCIVGATNNPYPGGNVYANDFSPFVDYDFTFRTYSCEGGGGPIASCDFAIASFGFEDGRGCGAFDSWTSANDIIVPADTDMTLKTVIPNIFMNPGATATSVLVTIYNEVNSLPGTVVNTQTIVPTSNSVVGSNYGLDVSEVTLDLTPVSLPGAEGVATSYWVAIQVTTSDSSLAYWENSTADAIGQPLAFSDGGAFTIPDASQDGVYTFIADCTGGGGSTGDACQEENPNDFTFENGFNTSSATAFRVANDLTVAPDENFTLSSITASIFANGGIANVDVVYYKDNGGLPGAEIGSEAAVTIDSQTVIGSNFGFDVNEIELSVTPFVFTGQAGVATTYWISLVVTDGGGTGSVFWVVTSSSMLGNPTAQLDGAWGTPDALMDGVYIWKGECGPITSDPFPAPYCGPLVFPTVEPITLVEVAGISNRSAAAVNGSPAHENFTAITGEVRQGDTYSIVLEGNTAGSWTNRFVVFVDWNQNGILDDAGEVYVIPQDLINSTGVDGKQVTGNILVPANAVLGNTRMRVKKTFQGPELDPCVAGSTWGQAEDYTLNVDVSLGITEVDALASFSFYPNPSSDIVYLKAADNIKSVSIYNLLGQQVFNVKIESKTSQINISDLSSGTYVLKVNVDGAMGTYKLLKK